jgi:hypothetical protein
MDKKAYEEFISERRKESYKKGLIYEQIFSKRPNLALIQSALAQVPLYDRIEVLQFLKRGGFTTPSQGSAAGVRVAIPAAADIRNHLAGTVPEASKVFGTEELGSGIARWKQDVERVYRDEQEDEEEEQDVEPEA